MSGETNLNHHTQSGLARGQLLGQLAPANTTAATLFTAISRTEVTLLIIANTTATTATARVFHDEAGSTYVAGNALYYDIDIPGKTSLVLDSSDNFSGITLAATDSLGVRTGTNSALTFTAYGTREYTRR